MTKRLYNPAVIDNMSVRTVEGTLLISWTTFSLGSSKPRKSRFPHGEQPRQPLRRNSPRVRELSSFSPQATGPDDSCFGVPLATLRSSCIPRPPHAPRNGYDRNRKQPLQQGLMASQPSSLHTSFRALCTTRIEIKESVIYTAERDRDSLSRKARISLRLN